MDFLGPSGVGMMIDFGTGLAMHTNDSTPVIYQLEANQKGHRVLDIVYHLTQGQRSNEGQAHVIVRDLSSQEDSSNQVHQLLELGTMYIDMAASDHAPSEHALALTRDRMWQLYQHGHPGAPLAASTAQMGASSYNLQPTPSSSRSFGHGSAVLAAADLPQPGRRADSHCSGKGQSIAQEEVQITGSGSTDSGGPPRPQVAGNTVALLREAHASIGSEQCTRKLDHVQLLQPEASLHSSKRVTFEQHCGGQPSNGEPNADGASSPSGQHQAHGQGVSPHDEQDHGRGGSPRVHQRTQDSTVPRLSSLQDEANIDRVEFPTINDLGNGGSRRGAGDRLRGGNRAAVRAKGLQQLPLYMAKKVMAVATLVTAMTATMLTDLQLDGRDGLWEIACSPHSWLSSAAEEHGLRPFRVNLAAGFDLYDPEVWNRLRDLRRVRRPKRIWISVPCTKWCPWTSVNFNTPEKQVKLETARRRERRMLWNLNQFLKETLDEDEHVDLFFEWPHPSFGWRQAPLQDLARHFEAKAIPWLPCRIDGCNYGMKNEAGTAFVHKKWLIRTTSERFHKEFRSKLCPGNHEHCLIQGTETSRSSYYPWRMVQSIARFWQRETAPDRHGRLLLHHQDLQPDLDEFEVMEGNDEILPVPSDHLFIEEADFYNELDLLNGTTDRLHLEDLSREARLRNSFSFETCEAILMHLQTCGRQPGREHSRGNMPGVNSFVIGAYSHGNLCGVTRLTTQLREMSRYLVAFVNHHSAHKAFSSIMVAYNNKTAPHRDYHNAKGLPSVLIGMGNYENGGLWQQGEPPPGIASSRRLVPGRGYVKGYVRPTFHRVIHFDPHQVHAAQSWKGYRITLTAFSTRLMDQLSPPDKQVMRDIGFPSYQSNAPPLSTLMVGAAELPGEDEPVALPPLPEGVTQAEVDSWTAKISKIHKAAGHPSNKNLARVVKDGGHPEWKVQIALQHKCSACESLKAGGTSSGQIPPAATHSLCKAWQSVAIDAAEWHIPGSKKKVKFLLFTDMATKLRVVAPLMTYDVLAMKSESAEEVIQSFAEKWLAVFPKPEVAVMDSAYSFSSTKMHDFLSSVNIFPHFVAEKEAWAHGIAESSVQDVKRTATAIQLEALDQNPHITLYLAVSALNSTEYTAGFSAFQWAYGQSYHISDEDARTFASLPDEARTDFNRLVTARERAEEVARRTRSLRVLSKLSNTTVRQPLHAFKEMDLVKIWRKYWPAEVHQGPRGGLKKSGKPHWVGPGRVIFHEVLPHQNQGDSRRHLVWVLVGSQLHRCSVHSVRPVTATERFVFETSDQEDFSWFRKNLVKMSWSCLTFQRALTARQWLIPVDEYLVKARQLLR